MIRQLIKTRRRQVLIDVNTQKDFFLDDGKAKVGNRRRVLIHIRRMMALARSKHIPVISISEVHPECNGEEKYCIDGTEGEQKIQYTLLNSRASFAADNNTDLPVDLLRRYHQIILHKRSLDPFDEPRIDRLLSEIRASDFVIIGASTEGAVEATVLGLLQRGKHVSVVVDAVGAQDKQKAKHSLRKIAAKGARLVETKKMAGQSHLKSAGVLKESLAEEDGLMDMVDIAAD